MSMRTVELVSEWDTVPFDGGYGGLRSLSDQGFSGAVTAGPTQLFMLNGTVVGILDGDIEAFDGADGTARTAPHDALPLLVVMQDQAGEPRAQYYTEDTSISDVDRTLEDGNFTGYVELSENVLSGDYYLVYHQGRSMSVAWVGNSQRLVTDEEAFEQADGEVGIYKVMPASIEPIEIPEPSSPTDETATAAETAADDDESDDDSAGTGASGAVTGDEAAASREDTTPTTDDGASDQATPSEPGESAPGEAVERAGPPGSKAAGASQGTAVDRQQRDETTAREVESGTTGEAATSSARETATSEAESTPSETGTDNQTTSDTEAAPGAAGAAEPTATETEPVEPAEPRTGRTAESPATAERNGDSQSTATAADSDAVGALETLSVPSLDPERSSSTPEPATTSAQTAESQQPTTSESSESAEPPTTQTGGSAGQASTVDGPDQPQSAEPAPTEKQQPEPSPEIEAELEDRKEEIAELEGEIRELSTENEELVAERDRLRGELEEAQAEIQRLEEELAAAGGPAPSGRALSAAEAIDGTNLFLRYHSKGEATLAKAQEGSADRASVEENLRLEYHTQFDAEDAAVDGEAFEAFLHDSIHYRFADWLVRNLLYEIRDTGHESEMGVLYDALPEIDRAELNGQVSVTYTEDGQEHRSQETFDVVVRDRMGNPLVVANINDSRQPATDGQMTDIVRNAERVGNASNSLAAAFLVTSSFFEPEALETAKEATSSGLFSRDKRKSFVNLSRKSGYHLCLLEARNKEFHLAVPEL